MPYFRTLGPGAIFVGKFCELGSGGLKFLDGCKFLGGGKLLKAGGFTEFDVCKLV